jgi:hypothetical protein
MSLAEFPLIPVASRKIWGKDFIGEVTCFPACFSSDVLHNHFHLPEHEKLSIVFHASIKTAAAGEECIVLNL